MDRRQAQTDTVSPWSTLRAPAAALQPGEEVSESRTGSKDGPSPFA